MDSYKVCHLEGCNNKAAGRGLCWKHYRRLLRNGNVSDPEYINKGKICSIDDCDKEAHVHGMCVMHYRRVLNHSDPNIVLKPYSHNGHVCIVPNCNERVSGNVFCHNHYHNYLYHLRRENIQTLRDYLDYLQTKESN